MGKEIPDLQLEWQEMRALNAALHRVQAVIEFDLKGRVLDANDHFLALLGYTLEQVRGQHHRLFCEPAYAASAEYKKFWERLAAGEPHRGEYRHLAADGREVWIDASYSPVMNGQGKPYKVVEFATDVTASRIRNADVHGRMAALDKSQAVIEFDLDGHVLAANANFLATIGYPLEEIAGRHHRMFCDEAYVASPEYAAFWEKLRGGRFDSGRYRRFGKGGRTIWLQASYNPVYDVNGRLCKVIKFAADVTAQVELEESVKRRAEEDQRKVDRLLETVKRAAAGDLTGDIDLAGDEPIDQLAEGIRQMMGDLRHVIGKVIAGAQRSSQASTEIAGQSNAMASGAQLLGATVEEMNATIEELTASINSIAGNARNADQLAKARRGYDLLQTLGFWLPVAWAAAVALTLVLARRRWAALAKVALVSLPMLGLLALALAFTKDTLTSSLPQREVAVAIWDVVVASLWTEIWVAAAAAAVVAVVAGIVAAVSGRGNAPSGDPDGASAVVA